MIGPRLCSHPSLEAVTIDYVNKARCLTRSLYSSCRQIVCRNVCWYENALPVVKVMQGVRRPGFRW